MDLRDESVLHAPSDRALEGEGFVVLLDSASPNWIATDKRGASVMAQFVGGRPFRDVVCRYALDHDLQLPKARQHVETIVRDALRQGYLTAEPPVVPEYAGREVFLEQVRLHECWIHTNNSCNLACSHCLVSSGSDGNPGLPFEQVVETIHQARALGTTRFYFTGGEPMARVDFFQLVDAVLDDPAAELAVLTNGILIQGNRLSELVKRDPARLRLQISLDGSTPEINDRIRGAGSFRRILDGIRRAVEAGLTVTVSTAVTKNNVSDLSRVTRLLGDLGVQNHHLLWLHKRGRADDCGSDAVPEIPELIRNVRKARRVGSEVGVRIDNCEAMKARLATPRGVKHDLSNACVTSLCVYCDGKVYPSAATANVPELCLGDLSKDSLEDIWKCSEVARLFRGASVAKKEICPSCPYKFTCGGGDIEHAYFYGGSVNAHDPYCELHIAMIEDAFQELVDEQLHLSANGKTGFDAPIVLMGMGENVVHCATSEAPTDVVTSHSECVLSFDLDAPRKLVREYYGVAAETPQEELCCPVQPEPEDLSHIPDEVVKRYYGCGSPVGSSNIQAGETTLDLGCGAGIDVFIAARRVGPTGKAIGVDMTDRMLEEAHRAKPVVAENLGYDAAEFRKGFLEEIPAEDGEVDLVTSNCVINLSPEKRRVFKEMWRVLKDHGRIVVSDIVAEQEVPLHQRRDPRLWSECISGALTEEEFLAYLERAGFYGVQVMERTFWKEVEGYSFHSVTVQAHKFEKKDGCVYAGQQAVYLGPFKSVSDEEGHLFPRGVPIEVCTDTAAKLSAAPYAGQFLILDSEESAAKGCC